MILNVDYSHVQNKEIWALDCFLSSALVQAFLALEFSPGCSATCAHLHRVISNPLSFHSSPHLPVPQKIPFLFLENFQSTALVKNKRVM